MYRSAIVVSLLAVLSVAAPGPLRAYGDPIIADHVLTAADHDPLAADIGPLDSRCKLGGKPGVDEPIGCEKNVTYYEEPSYFNFKNWSDLVTPVFRPEDCNPLADPASPLFDPKNPLDPRNPITRACDELNAHQPKLESDKGRWFWFKFYACTVGYMIPPMATVEAITPDQCKNQILLPMVNYAIENQGHEPPPSYSINLSSPPKKNRVYGEVVAPDRVAFMITGEPRTCDRCSH